MDILNIISPKSKVGKNTKIWHFVQIREDAEIGDNCIIGKNCYIDFGVKIGNNVKIQNNSSIYNKATIEDGVLIGPHVCFTNDNLPRAINMDGTLKNADDWKRNEIIVRKGASIGANSTILTGVIIGEFALIGAGSVITKNIPSHAIAFGKPTKIKGYICKCCKVKVGLEAEELNCESCGTKIKLK